MKRSRLVPAAILGLVLGLAQDSWATVPNAAPDQVAAAFRQLVEVAPVISTPGVVQVPLDGLWLERPDIAVFDLTDSVFVPALFVRTAKQQAAALSATSPSRPRLDAVVDDSPTTYVHFDLPDEGQGSVSINIQSTTPATFSGLSTLLSPNVALPTDIEIRSVSPGPEKIVVARQPMKQSTILFPATSATDWRVTFTFGQPLRIAELKLIQEDTSLSAEQYARFLAHPEHRYNLYLNADRLPAGPHPGEAPNLRSDIDVIKLAAASLAPNPAYSVADIDEDGIPDLRDNCVNDSNPDQTDANSNGRGDICDDFDKDGLINSRDNCPDDPNRGQADEDGDGLGDACDDEESRLTEAYPWLPWAGLGAAALVVVALLTLTTRSLLQEKPAGGAQNHPTNPSDSASAATPTDRAQQ